MKSAYSYFLFVLLFFLLACQAPDSSPADENNIPPHTELQKQINVQNFFNTLPSSKEIFEMIKECNINYVPDYLNNPSQYKNYTLEKSKALNFGIYGTDMAVSTIFKQAQECTLFLKSINFIANELGINNAFNENIMNRLEINQDNRDSVLQLVSQIFKKSDKIFSENKRPELSVLMITGAYIEALYVCGRYIDAKLNDTSFYNKIIKIYQNQTESFQYLIDLLKASNDADDIIFREKLINIADKFKHQNQPMSKETFKETHQLVSELRNQIINVY